MKPLPKKGSSSDSASDAKKKPSDDPNHLSVPKITVGKVKKPSKDSKLMTKLEQSASHDLLARHFLEIFPQLEGLRFTHRWAGVIDTTTRFTPVFGTALGGENAGGLR